MIAIGEDPEIPPEEIECSCEPTGENLCRLQEIECESDADCPAGFSCGPAVITRSCDAMEGGEEECSESEMPRHCQPEGWANDTIYDQSGEVDGRADKGDDNEETGAPMSSDADSTPADPTVEQADDSDVPEEKNDKNGILKEEPASSGCSVSTLSKERDSGLIALLNILF